MKENVDHATNTSINKDISENENTTRKEKVNMESRKTTDFLSKNFNYVQTIRNIYQNEINDIASELRLGLSILIRCDKIITEYLWNAIIEEAEKKYELLEIVDLEQGSASLLHDQIRMLRNKVRNINRDRVLIIPHLDLLAGGSSYLSEGARELTQLLYRNVDTVILAFADVSFEIPEILTSRFSLQKGITGVPRITNIGEETVPTTKLLLTEGELSYFERFDSEELYRVISGMNPFKIRQAVTHAINERKATTIKMEELKDAIRIFKSKTSNNFMVPNVGFDDIGGYAEVKTELIEAVALIQDASLDINDDLRQELIPKGFIFYGPPGTGKTLFAKAVANKLNANVMVVSGPEVITMWVGESERKIRETFSEARRNAPSVLVFDEFDSIATKRSSQSDGGARVGNSMVAQILTEMDGFRPDVPVLVIGTTNRLDIIDEALLRPSRFKPVAIELPDKDARKAISKIYSEKFDVPINEETLNCIAESTVGFNGDEIQSIFRNLSLELRLRETDLEESLAKKLGRVVGKIKFMKEKQNINSLSVNQLSPENNNTLYSIEF